MRRAVFFILFLISATVTEAQFSEHFASPRDYVYKDTVWIVSGPRELGPLFQKQKLDFVLDARQTLISKQQTRIGGIRIGIEYRRVHRFGFGLYGLGEGVKLTSLIELDPKINDAILKLSYISLFYERVLFFNRKWEWSATAHYGKGQITGVYRTSPDSAYRAMPIRDVRPFELSTTGYYNLTWWCSLGMGVGYRFMRSSPEEVLPVYNAPVAIARVRIKVGKLVKSIWDRDARFEY